MPNRVLRAALLESDRWIELHDNTSRVCWVAAFLTADDAGNMEASTPRLRRLWREYGVDTDTKVLAVLDALTTCDLMRMYEIDVDGHRKRYIHIPRFGQFLRHVRRRNPGSPWDDSQKIQYVAEKTQCERSADEVRTHSERNASASRSEVKRSEEKRINTLSSKLDDARQILEFLNEKTGRKYRSVEANLKLIQARISEGATVSDCRMVVARKCREWIGDEKMAKYLRPLTLFNRQKFAQYIGECV